MIGPSSLKVPSAVKLLVSNVNQAAVAVEEEDDGTHSIKSSMVVQAAVDSSPIEEIQPTL